MCCRSLRRLTTSMPPGGVTSRVTAPARGRRDAILRSEIRRVWEENFRVYGGLRKVWRRQLGREGICADGALHDRSLADAADGAVGGAIRGKAIKTTIGNPAAPCPRDKVNRQFRAAAAECRCGWRTSPMSRRPGRGLYYVAFVIDAFARRIMSAGASGALGRDCALSSMLSNRRFYDRRPFLHGLVPP